MSVQTKKTNKKHKEKILQHNSVTWNGMRNRRTASNDMPHWDKEDNDAVFGAGE